MIDKIADIAAEAIGEVVDGSVGLLSSFGTASIPDVLIDGLIEQSFCLGGLGWLWR